MLSESWGTFPEIRQECMYICMYVCTYVCNYVPSSLIMLMPDEHRPSSRHPYHRLVSTLFSNASPCSCPCFDRARLPCKIHETTNHQTCET